MITVLTYDHPHKKTQDLLFNLVMSGYRDIQVIATEWIERSNFGGLYNYVNKPIPINLSTYCSYLSILFIRRNQKLEDVLSYDLKKGDKILLGGSGVLPENIVEDYFIINSHPAYLPYCRGLDALKWSIYYGYPIGVTTHVVNKDVDKGRIIEQEIVPVNFTDSFHSIAKRQYDTEIEMLVKSVELTKDKKKYNLLKIEDTVHTKDIGVNRRIPHRQEIVMMKRLQKIIDSKNE